MQIYTYLFTLKRNSKQICVYKHCLTIKNLNTLLYEEKKLCYMDEWYCASFKCSGNTNCIIS